MQAVTLLAFVGASHCILLAFVTYFQSRTPRASDRILIAILVIEGLRLFSLAAINAGLPDGPWLYPHSLRLAIGPLVFFYTGYLVGSTQAFTARSLLHFAPVVLVTLILMLNGTGLYNVSREEWFRPIALIEGLMFTTYGYAAWRKVDVYSSDLLNTHSAIENLNLGWVKWVCYCVIGMGIALIAGVVYMSAGALALSVSDGVLISSLTTLVFCYVIALKGIQQSRYFEQLLFEDSLILKPTPTTQPTGESGGTEKYLSSTLSKADAEHFYGLLVEVMEREKLFLRHRLKLADLARETGLHPQQVSQVINQCAHKHFYDFVNAYRVEEVLRLLQDDASRGANILDTADQSGFNSPATFYKYFRKYTGKSPRKYLQEAMK